MTATFEKPLDIAGTRFVSKWSIEKTVSKPLPSIQQSAHRKDADFDSILTDIEKWIPLRRYPNEDGYSVDLHNFLGDKCGYSVRLEGGESQADILVDDHIPIEIKKNPTQPEYDRMLGQLVRHERAHGCAIGVVCDVRRQKMFIDAAANIERSAGEKKIRVIAK